MTAIFKKRHVTTLLRCALTDLDQIWHTDANYHVVDDDV